MERNRNSRVASDEPQADYLLAWLKIDIRPRQNCTLTETALAGTASDRSAPRVRRLHSRNSVLAAAPFLASLSPARRMPGLGLPHVLRINVTTLANRIVHHGRSIISFGRGNEGLCSFVKIEPSCCKPFSAFFPALPCPVLAPLTVHAGPTVFFRTKCEPFMEFCLLGPHAGPSIERFDEFYCESMLLPRYCHSRKNWVKFYGLMEKLLTRLAPRLSKGCALLGLEIPNFLYTERTT